MFVPRTLAAALTKHTDSESSLYALGGIRLERDDDGKPHAIATDGRRLVHVTWSEADCGAPGEFPQVDAESQKPVNGFATIIPPAVLTAADKAAKIGKRCFKPILKYLLVDEPSANGTVRVVATNLESTTDQKAQSVEGKFPQWREVFKRYRIISRIDRKRRSWLPGQTADRVNWPAVSVRLNARFLAELCDTFNALTGEDRVAGEVDLIVPVGERIRTENADGQLVSERIENGRIVILRGRRDGVEVEAVVCPLD